jgi:hypothetical protein
MNTGNKESNENALVLFELTQPDLTGIVGFKQTERRNAENRMVGVSLKMEDKKDTAKRLGKPVKSTEVAEERLKRSNHIKEIVVAEILKMATSPGWTGSTARLTRNQNGDSRFAFSLVTVRDKHQLTKAELAKALAQLSDDEQTEVMDKVEAFRGEAAAIEA